ncbi:MAG: hypothetical protein ACREP7_12950 [Lysobacter sp.]
MSAVRKVEVAGENGYSIEIGPGLLEEACRDWGRMLDDYPAVQSGWCDRRYQIMMTELRRYQRNPHARDLYERGQAHHNHVP